MIYNITNEWEQDKLFKTFFMVFMEQMLLHTEKKIVTPYSKVLIPRGLKT